jgi:hypothetical protein
MTLSPPVSYTAATGGFITSALWNAQVRDANQFFAAPPSFRAHSEVAQTITNNAWISYNLEVEEFDAYGGHSTTTNTSRYTCQVAGLYLCTGIATFAANATGLRGGRLAVNGSAYHGTFVKETAFASGSNAIGTTAIIPLAVGDYVEVQGNQNSGVDLAASSTSGDVAPSLACLWVGVQ